MIKLKITNEFNDIFLKIRKNNKILIKNELGVINLYLLLYKMICGRNSDIQGYLENKNINQKDFILINFLNYEEFNNALLFKKDSLLYYYTESIIKESIDSFDEMIYNKIISFVDNSLEKSNLEIDYQLDENSLKLIFSICNFRLKNNEKYLSSIEIMLDSILRKENFKKYIVFYNSKIINIDFSKYDCCYSFDIAAGYPIEEYNLISFKNELKEFNLEILEKEIEFLWPISYNQSDIKKYMKRYFEQYISLNELNLESKNDIIMASIIQKLFNINQKTNYDSSSLDNNIKSFLTNL